MIDACAECLRRGHLVGFLAGRVTGRLGRPGARAVGLLTLAEPDLIAALAGEHAEAARASLAGFDADAARRALERDAIAAVCRHAGGYPPSLLELEDPPAVLYATCDPERLGRLLAEPAVAIVGARRGSTYSRDVARDLGRGLAAAGVTVISGLALGVDAAAHEGALAVDGPAIAVLAGGVDVPYPRRHRELYRRLRSTGAVVAELPPGRPGPRWAFPARNRIMAGLTRMTVVVEAAERSGSLITAHFALDLGREVGAVPGRVTARVAAGSNRLLQEGAALIRGPEDVLDVLYGVGRRRDPLPAAPRIDPGLRRVLDVVEAGDDFDGALPALSASEVRVALGRLESLGLIRRDGLGSYERAPPGGGT